MPINPTDENDAVNGAGRPVGRGRLAVIAVTLALAAIGAVPTHASAGGSDATATAPPESTEPPDDADDEEEEEEEERVNDDAEPAEPADPGPVVWVGVGVLVGGAVVYMVRRNPKSSGDDG